MLEHLGSVLYWFVFTPVAEYFGSGGRLFNYTLVRCDVLKTPPYLNVNTLMSGETCYARSWSDQSFSECPIHSNWKCELCNECFCHRHCFRSSFFQQQGTRVNCTFHTVCWDCYSTLLSLIIQGKSIKDYNWVECCELLHQYWRVQQ